MRRTQIRSRLGFSLVEILATVSILITVFGAMTLFMSQSGRLAQKNQDETQTVAKARKAIDEMASDIESADAVLRQYPPTGTPSVVTDQANVLILRQPQFATDGSMVSGSWNVVIYRLEAVAGQAGPFALRRYTGTIVGGVASAASLSSTVAEQVGGMELGYTASQRVVGSTTQSSYPLAEASYSQKSTCAPPARILYAGTDLTASSAARISGDSGGGLNLTLSGELPANGTLDVSYPIIPARTSLTDGLTGTSMVTVLIYPVTKWKTTGFKEKSTPLNVMSSTFLRNR